MSALLLFLRTQLYTLPAQSGQLDQLFSGPSAPADLPAAAPAAEVGAPVRVAVSGGNAYGRYGNVTLTTADEGFVPLRTFLQEALGSAGAFSLSSQTAFARALEQSSVYYDFLQPLPLSVLAELVDAAADQDGITVRQLVLSASGEDAVQLTVSDGSGTCLRCDTAISPSDLLGTVSSFALGSGYFASDYTALDQHYRQLDPWSLFQDPLPQLPVLNTVTPDTASHTVLEALGFNPHTNSRYTEANGTEVIVEGDHSLRLSPGGMIRYNGGVRPEESGLTVEAADELPTLQEAAVGVGSLLARLSDGAAGRATLYLLDIRRSGTTTTLTFDYQLGGIPIRQTDGLPAAQVQLSGDSVAALSLRLRQYAPGADASLLLPLRQAVAIAARQSDKELYLAYTDDGSDTLSAGWLLN